LLRFQPGKACSDESTVFTGVEYHVEVDRRRFAVAPTNVVSIRKPPQRETGASWRSKSIWAGAR
jgi:recombination protein RecA